MEKPADFENVQAAGDYETLEVGAYKCIIKKVEELKANNDKTFLKISFDIAEGKYKEFYKRKYQSDTRDPKVWSGIWNVFVLDYNENTSKYFKGLVTCLEASNKGFKFDFEKPELAKDMKIGIVFRDEEFESFDGQILTSAKPFRACVYEKTEEAKIPNKKELKNKDNIIDKEFDSVTSDDDELPF